MPRGGMRHIKSAVRVPFSYKVGDSKPDKKALIQTVSFDAISEMNQDAIRKVNATLIDASFSFDREVKECSATAHDHP